MGTFKFDDTFPSMSTYDFVELLEKHGFRLGFEMPEIHDYRHEKISKQIYYQPEQKMVACVTVPENEKSEYNHLNYFAGTVHTQRDSRPKDVMSDSDSSGPFYDSKDGFYLEKDIRDNVFKWYDTVVSQTQPLPELIPDNSTVLKLMHMFNNSSQVYFSQNCPAVERWENLRYYGPFRDIVGFYNMSQIQDEGLMQMLAPVMESMPTRVEEAIFEVLNGDTYRPHERNEAALSWVMEQLGIDKDWFKQQGVDVDLALQPPINATLEFIVSGPAPMDLMERHQLLIDAARDFRTRTGTHVTRDKCQFEGDKIFVQMKNEIPRVDDRKAAEIMQTILRDKGLNVSVRKPPLKEQIASAEAKRQAQKEDHTQQRTPDRRDQGRS